MHLQAIAESFATVSSMYLEDHAASLPGVLRWNPNERSSHQSISPFFHTGDTMDDIVIPPAAKRSAPSAASHQAMPRFADKTLSAFDNNQMHSFHTRPSLGQVVPGLPDIYLPASDTFEALLRTPSQSSLRQQVLPWMPPSASERPGRQLSFWKPASAVAHMVPGRGLPRNNEAKPTVACALHAVRHRHPPLSKESQAQPSTLADMARHAVELQVRDIDDLLDADGLCAFSAQLSDNQVEIDSSHLDVDPAAPCVCTCCGVQITSYASFSHRCPKCGIIICHHCVEDFKLIITTYRCPQCGEQEANQALLMDTEWRRSALRATRGISRSFGESLRSMFAADDEVDEDAYRTAVSDQDSTWASYDGGAGKSLNSAPHGFQTEASQEEITFFHRISSLWSNGDGESVDEESFCTQPRQLPLGVVSL